jgi:hypothetical protein
VPPLTVRHVFDFGADRELVGDDLVRPASWDALRTRTDGPFGLPADRAIWEHAAQGRPELAARAVAVADWTENAGVTQIASYGVGSALMELLLWHRRPSCELVLSDYTPTAVTRLAELFPESEVQRFDLLADLPLRAEVHLFHRIDTEFTNVQWRAILRRFAGTRILFAASEVADLRRMSWEVRSRFSRARTTRAGWLRNRDAFERLWRDTHDATPLRLHDLEAWDLRPRCVSAAR